MGFRFEAELASNHPALGDLYLHGQGVRQDLVLAHAHSRIAAELDAEGMAPKIKPFLKVIEGRMTPDEISRARDVAREWLVIHRR